MGEENGFYTMKGYRSRDPAPLTESMEDYIEMICRICARDGFARIGDLSRSIHVSPSSASKMANKLEAMQLISFPKYGMLQPTARGRELGAYLIRRHETLERFLRLVNGTNDETKQAEQIEHFVTGETVENIEKAARFLLQMKWQG